jgi:serine protease Do
MKAILFLLATQLGLVSLSSAQKKEKTERIIIQKKSDKPEKMVIEIDGDKVIVNGREVKEGDSNIVIKEFGERDIYMRMPQIEMKQFRNMQHNWEHMERNFQDRNRNFQRKMQNVQERIEKRVLLGVVTEKTDKGLKITEVSKESAAEAAGLQVGDIITKVDGKEMNETDQLIDVIRSHKNGDEITVEYLRDGKKKTTKASLKTMEVKEEFEFNWEPKEFPHFNMEGLKELELIGPHGFNDDHLFIFRKGPKLGATIQDTEDGKGVTVEEVEAESLAAKNGLQKGDRITEINGDKINNVADAREALNKGHDKSIWTIQVQRSGKPVTIEIKVPKKLNRADLKP